MNEQLEHELVCNLGTPIDRLKKEVANLNEMIKGYETYSKNTLFITQLKNIKQRMLTDVKDAEKHFNAYVDYNESLKQIN